MSNELIFALLLIALATGASWIDLNAAKRRIVALEAQVAAQVKRLDELSGDHK